MNGEGRKAPAVVVVDHTGKPNKNADGPDITQHAIRGASAKVNAARVAMLMVPAKGDDAVVDCEGRTAEDPGFNSAETAKVFAGDVVWHVVKNNGQRKADPVTLSFTRRGGLHVEAPADAKARRKRQFMAAQKRGTTTKEKTGAPKNAAKPSTARAGKVADIDVTGDD